jgi:hypothetical protein
VSAYEELYAKLWRAQARKEGHKPGFPESKEKFTGGTPPSPLERIVVERLRAEGRPMTTTALAPALGRERKAVSGVLASLRMKGLIEAAGKNGHFRLWRLVG